MAGIGVPRLGWRNLWRHRRRTLITLSSISFGIVLAVLFTGIGDSNWRQMIDLAARLLGGHVTLQHAEYLDTPSLSRSVSNVTQLRALAEADPDVRRSVVRISGQVMLATSDQSYGAGFLAIDPAVEDSDSLSILDALSEGTLFESADAPGIVLGGRLADNLGADLGRKVVYTMTDKHGEIVRAAARVTGLIRTGAPTVDSALCLLPIDSLRELLAYGPDEATQVGLFLRDQRSADAVSARLRAKVGPGVAALPWHGSQPDLAAFIAMKIAGARLMEFIIAVLVAAGIFNTLFVSVMERMREFGIMLALGFSPRRLFGMVMMESLWLGALGVVGAVVIGAWPYYYLNRVGIDISAQLDVSGSEIAGVAMSPVMRADIYGENALIIAVAALGATLLAGIYPAWQAGRVAPVETIRLV